MQPYNGAENFDLRKTLLEGRSLRLAEKAALLQRFLKDLDENGEILCMRRMLSPAGREVLVGDSSGAAKMMLMFGSNNYLGLADHPKTKLRVQEAIRRYGVGIGGPPLLNGHTGLHAELEARLAALKGSESAMIFPSGYGANVGLVTGLVNPDDTIIYDAYSHASFCDGVRMSGVQHAQFLHNDVENLKAMLERRRSSSSRDIFVGVEGVYSMDGDLAPLGRIVPLVKKSGAILIVDDAHGTGVMGEHGRGTAEHFGLEGSVDITMGTFSKVFAVTGGFVASSKPVIDYLRYFARSYMFSASLPPPVVAAVLAGLEVMEAEPELLEALREVTQMAASGLRALGFSIPGEAPIIPLRVPLGMNIRRMARRFHNEGLFVNMIEYPAVPLREQRFRISLMATHTHADIRRLIRTVEKVWAEEQRLSAAHQPECGERYLEEIAA